MEGVPNSKEQLLAEMKDLRSVCYGDEKLYEELVNFAKHLRETYSNCEEYELFHLIAGSTMREEPEFFDFPEEDSIVSFLRNITNG